MKFLENLFGGPPALSMELKTYSTEIEQVHHEFESASDSALAEALGILKQGEDKSIEKGRRLKSLGFAQAKEAREANYMEHKVGNALEIKQTILKYRRLYPRNKFITAEQVQTICRKYGLVCAGIERYEGFVPEKNLRDVEKFKVDKRDVPFKIKSIGISDRWIGEVLNDNGESADRWGSLYKKEKHYESMQICAPKKQMNLSGLTNTGAIYTEKIDVPDPVVLQPVKGGYLIVTAWGDEASDPIVVNENNN